MSSALIQALAKLELRLMDLLQHLLPVLDVDLLRREPARPHQLSAAPARPLPEGIGIDSGLQQRPQLLSAFQDVGGHSDFFY